MDTEQSYTDYQLWRLLSSTYRRINYSLERSLRRYGLSSDTEGILHLIYLLNNNATPTEIAKRALRKPQTITSRIDVMVKKGLLVKTRDSDKKNMFRVSMTEKGKRIYFKSVNIKRYSQIMSVLKKDKRQIFEECLKELREHTQKLK